MNPFRAFWNKHPLIIFAAFAAFFVVSYHVTNLLRASMQEAREEQAAPDDPSTSKTRPPTKEELTAVLVKRFNSAKGSALTGPTTVEVLSVDVIPRTKRIVHGGEFRDVYPCRIRWKTITREIRVYEPNFNRVDEYDYKNAYAFWQEFGDLEVGVRMAAPSHLGTTRAPYSPHPEAQP